MSLERVKNFMKIIEKKNIHFKEHFIEKTYERFLRKEAVITYLRDQNRIVHAKQQYARGLREEKYKIWIQLKKHQYLILIIVISEENLYIISGWGTHRKWKEEK